MQSHIVDLLSCSRFAEALFVLLKRIASQSENGMTCLRDTWMNTPGPVLGSAINLAIFWPCKRPERMRHRAYKKVFRMTQVIRCRLRNAKLGLFGCLRPVCHSSGRPKV